MDKWTPKQQNLFYRILEYIDKHNLFIDFYDGVVEPGYDDVPTALANWNSPSNHPDSYDMKHSSYYEERKRTSRLAPLLTKLGFELDWSDEWDSCYDCGKLVRTSPDSYGWEPYYIIFNDCELVCNECAKEHIEDVIEEYVNTHLKALTSDWREAIEKAGFHCIEDECEIYETGFYPGQNDKPEKALQSIYDKVGEKWFTDKFDYLFIINSVGQFDIHWTILIRNKQT